VSAKDTYLGYACGMAKEFITAHIKLESWEFASLAHHAQGLDLSAAQLIRRILRGWLEGQVYVENTEDGPVTAQHAGHRGFDPNPVRPAELTCNCGSCTPNKLHTSDCAVYNEPAFANAECNCLLYEAKFVGNFVTETHRPECEVDHPPSQPCAVLAQRPPV